MTDQRHRSVINGTINTSIGASHNNMAAHQPRISVERHGPVPLRAAVQYHVGRDELQRTTGRPLGRTGHRFRDFDVRSVSFIPRNSGTGSDFFGSNLRLGRAICLTNDLKVEGLVEAFNLTNRVDNPPAM